MGDKNASGSRGGTIRRRAVKVAKAAGYTTALGAGTIATGVKKRSTSSFNKGSRKKP